MKRETRKGAGGPSFCWHCWAALEPVKNEPGMQRYFFHVVRDPGGHEHRVHGTCLKDVESQGLATYVPPTKESK